MLYQKLIVVSAWLSLIKFVAFMLLYIITDLKDSVKYLSVVKERPLTQITFV